MSVTKTIRINSQPGQRYGHDLGNITVTMGELEQFEKRGTLAPGILSQLKALHGENKRVLDILKGLAKRNKALARTLARQQSVKAEPVLKKLENNAKNLSRVKNEMEKYATLKTDLLVNKLESEGRHDLASTVKRDDVRDFLIKNKDVMMQKLLERRKNSESEEKLIMRDLKKLGYDGYQSTASSIRADDDGWDVKAKYFVLTGRTNDDGSTTVTGMKENAKATKLDDLDYYESTVDVPDEQVSFQEFVATTKVTLQRREDRSSRVKEYRAREASRAEYLVQQERIKAEALRFMTIEHHTPRRKRLHA